VKLSELRLANFRNYRDLEVEFASGKTLFFGENGQGKTNLVEAIGYLANFQSHRVAGYQSVIKDGEISSQLAATAVVEKRQLKIAIELNSESPNRFWLNGNLRKRSADLAGVVSAVTFSPEDIDIIRRDPTDRRRFLDHLAVQLSPKFTGVLSDYDRVLKQRNTLLKTAKSNAELSTLDIWNDQLASLGVAIMRERSAVVSQLIPHISAFYSELLGKPASLDLHMETTALDHESLQGIDASEQYSQFIEKLAEVRTRELERGITLVGPHRDELVFSLDEKTAREHASQGEAWSLALGAKLASAELIKIRAETGDPILILDDVFSVLDPKRRERLAHFVSTAEQVFITATTPDDLPKMEWAATHRVTEGALG
jgi:DNA replication and repair protein RecF